MTWSRIGILQMIRLHQNPLEQQTCHHPEWRIIQPDETVHIVFFAAVVPGAHMMFPQQGSAEIFKGKDAKGIDHAPKKRRFSFDFFIYRYDESRHSVDRKHPYGGLSNEPVVLAQKRTG